MRNLVLSVVFVAGCLSARSSFAQVLPSASHLTLTNRGAFLLPDPGVAKKLNLSDAQRNSVQRILDGFYSRQEVLLRKPGNDQEPSMKLDRSTSTSLLGVLTGVQRDRLFRATVHSAGYSALIEPEVIQQLSLKPAQTSRIQTILDAAAEPFQTLMGIIAKRISQEPKRALLIEKSYAPAQLQIQKAQVVAESKSLDVLTPAQRQKWHALAD